MQITYDETQLPAYLEHMRSDANSASREQETCAVKKRQDRGTTGKPQEHLLLFSGFSLVLLAAGMALSNVLS